MEKNRRILIIDDNQLIHGDFHKIFAGQDQARITLDAEADLLFGGSTSENEPVHFTVDSAYHGQEGTEKVRAAKTRNQPYAMAIVDMRMPVGWDGVETTKKLWEIDPDIQVVICTAYSDFSWREILESIGVGDRLLILKKPFEPIEAIQIANMLTEKWCLQKQVRQKMRDLEEAISKRTEELQNKNLDLKKKNAEIQYFYHTLSHELKTPLTSAREFIAIVTEGLVGELNETQIEYLNIATESCSRLGIYINDLFDAARLDTGKLSLDLKPASLSKLIQNVNIIMRAKALKMNIRLYMDLDTELPDVVVDENRVMQILTNLYNNAMKFTPEGGSVGVRLYQDPQNPEWVEISVADTGCGILEEQIEYLFDRYYQVEQVDPERAKGVGLGLYLIKELVGLHGGNISVESKLGKGTTFTITLPMTRDVATRNIQPLSAEERNQMDSIAPAVSG